MLKLDTYVCDECGEEFEAACFAEFKEKEKKHKCKTVNRRVVRFNELEQQSVVERVKDQATNAIEQYKFDKLVRQGVVVCSL